MQKFIFKIIAEAVQKNKKKLYPNIFLTAVGAFVSAGFSQHFLTTKYKLAWKPDAARSSINTNSSLKFFIIRTAALNFLQASELLFISIYMLLIYLPGNKNPAETEADIFLFK